MDLKTFLFRFEDVGQISHDKDNNILEFRFFNKQINLNELRVILNEIPFDDGEISFEGDRFYLRMDGVDE